MSAVGAVLPDPSEDTEVAWVHRRSFPSAQYCLRCGFPYVTTGLGVVVATAHITRYVVVVQHQDPFVESSVVFQCAPLCVACWEQLSPEKRWGHYRRWLVHTGFATGEDVELLAEVLADG